MKKKQTVDHIVKWLRNYCETSGMKGFVVGVSGGIDSALTSTLCAMTGKPTLLVEMPIHQAPSHVTRAQQHMAFLESLSMSAFFRRAKLVMRESEECILSFHYNDRDTTFTFLKIHIFV